LFVGAAELSKPGPPPDTPLRRVVEQFETAIDRQVAQAKLTPET
jgi:hypothetical protein